MFPSCTSGRKCSCRQDELYFFESRKLIIDTGAAAARVTQNGTATAVAGPLPRTRHFRPTIEIRYARTRTTSTVVIFPPLRLEPERYAKSFETVGFSSAAARPREKTQCVRRTRAGDVMTSGNALLFSIARGTIGT